MTTPEVDSDDEYIQTEFDDGDDGHAASSGGDNKGEDDYTNLSAEILAAASQLKDFSPASRITVLCNRLLIPAPKFNVSLADLEFSEFVRVAGVFTSIGVSNIPPGSIGICNPSHVQLMANYETAAIKASFKVPRVKSCQIFSQISIVKEVAGLFGAEYLVKGTKAYVNAEAFGIIISVGLKGILSGVCVEGGKEACEKISAIRGVPVEYCEIPAPVVQLVSLIMSRHTVAVVQNVLGFKEIPSKWDVAVLGPAYVDIAITATLNRFMAGMVKSFAVYPCPQGMAPKSSEYLTYLGTKYWKSLSEANVKTITNILESYSKRVIDSTKIADYVMSSTTGATVKTSIKYDGSGAARTCSIIAPTGDGMSVLPTFTAVDQYVESCRKVRDHKDFIRKADGPAYSGAAQSATSVPVKFKYALDRMGEEGVTMAVKAVDAYGVATHNHWEQVIQGFAETVSKETGARPSIVFKDIGAAYIPGQGLAFEAADITRLDPGSRAGVFLFDDTYVVSETVDSSKKRAKDGTMPLGKHNTFKKMEAILNAGYVGGIVKMVLGSEHSSGVAVGRIPPCLIEFRAKYKYVALFPGGSSHSQEYLMAFGSKPKDAEMFVRPSAAEDVFTDKFMDYGAWKSYISSWLIGKAVDCVRANKVNTINCYYGMAGGIFRPVMKSAAIDRSTDMVVPLAGKERLKGSAISIVASTVPDVGEAGDDFTLD